MDDTAIVRSFLTTLGLFVVVTAVALPVTVWRLKAHHRQAWDELVRSGAGRRSAAAIAWRLVRFALSLRHLRLADLTLSLACVAFALGVLAVLVGFVGWVQSVSAAG
ncbi:MAG TPA: hypothetical protein PKJ99_05635 [Thermoanaerobaculales bacterium]|nr:hypothetical protein [Thermoanaerobaculales bacterium]HPA81108.1 hypothetical protein [Thermoanaerobaculales bacterium]HQL28892.1 hypothetical protein [Thermoanaerobaculales bacterium]HQN96383.1 hypothetical protein [Thermoanaerobaculales bacterium]HQP44249.1 hypothetical protein [Thermoanaerobaculales bacterium]